MKMRSINLSEHEVLAALRGELSLVVRPVKPQPANGLRWNAVVLNGYGGWTDEHGKPSPCPLGVPGDRLVCKESHYIQGTHGQHRADGLRWGSWSGLPTTISPDGKQIAYYKEGFDRCAPMWRSSATMPRWASRITLEVEGVRCCRLDDLTVEDFIACGFSTQLREHEAGCHLKEQFKDSWNRRYGRRYPWESNPYVWAAKVKRVEK